VIKVEQELLELLEFIQAFFWILIPIVLVQISLTVIALWDWYKKRDYLEQNKLVWLLIILFFNFFGPVIYLWYSHNKMVKIEDSEDDWGTQ